MKRATSFIRSRIINKDPRHSGEVYIRMINEKRSGVDAMAQMISDPDNAWTTTPQNAMRYVEFMHKVGTLKKLPGDWRDLFMPEVHELKGSPSGPNSTVITISHCCSCRYQGRLECRREFDLGAQTSWSPSVGGARQTKQEKGLRNG